MLRRNVCDVRYITDSKLTMENTTNISLHCFIKQDTFSSKLVDTKSLIQKIHGLLIPHINIDKFKNCYNYLEDIQFTQFYKTSEIQ